MRKIGLIAAIRFALALVQAKNLRARRMNDAAFHKLNRAFERSGVKPIKGEIAQEVGITLAMLASASGREDISARIIHDMWNMDEIPNALSVEESDHPEISYLKIYSRCLVRFNSGERWDEIVADPGVLESVEPYKKMHIASALPLVAEK